MNLALFCGTKLRRAVPRLHRLGQTLIGVNLILAVINIFPQAKALFSRGTGGTAGQKGLNIIDTTIKCPKKVSHFRYARDTLGRGNTGGNATVRKRAPTLSIHFVLNTDLLEARSLTVAFLPVN